MPKTIRKASKPGMPSQQSLETTIHNLRLQVFQGACQSLQIARAVSEEALTTDPRRQEISDAVATLRRAVVDNGLEILRPLVAQLRARNGSDVDTALPVFESVARGVVEAEAGVLKALE